MSKVQHIKVTPRQFADVRSGVKMAEVRINDRDYRVGDTLVLYEWEFPGNTVPLTNLPEFSVERGYSGEVETRVVTHVLGHDDFAPVPEGWVVLSMHEVEEDDAANVQQIGTDRVTFGGRVPPKQVLEAAIDAGLHSVLVAGWIPEPGVEGPGELYVASSDRDDKTIYLLRRSENALLTGDL